MSTYDPQPGTAESAIESRAAKIIADQIYAAQYGDSTEFAGERMDGCDELTIEIIDQMAEHGLAITYRPELDQHQAES